MAMNKYIFNEELPRKKFNRMRKANKHSLQMFIFRKAGNKSDLILAHYNATSLICE